MKKMVPGAVMLSNGDTVETEVVVCDTGYESVFPIMDPKTVLEKLHFEDDSLWFYHDMLLFKCRVLPLVGAARTPL
jgi:hypothetical protein